MSQEVEHWFIDTVIGKYALVLMLASGISDQRVLETASVWSLDTYVSERSFVDIDAGAVNRSIYTGQGCVRQEPDVGLPGNRYGPVV